MCRERESCFLRHIHVNCDTCSCKLSGLNPELNPETGFNETVKLNPCKLSGSGFNFTVSLKPVSGFSFRV